MTEKPSFDRFGIHTQGEMGLRFPGRVVLTRNLMVGEDPATNVVLDSGVNVVIPREVPIEVAEGDTVKITSVQKKVKDVNVIKPAAEFFSRGGIPQGRLVFEA